MHSKYYEQYVKPVLSNMDDVALGELNANNLAHNYLEQIRNPRFVFRNKNTKQIVIHQIYWCVLNLYSQTGFLKQNTNKTDDVCANINNSRLKLSVKQGQEKNVCFLLEEMSGLPLLPVEEMLLGFTKLTQIAQLGANTTKNAGHVEKNITGKNKSRALYNIPLHILKKENTNQGY